MEIDKPIVIYGTGIEAEKFYYRYKEEYEIVFCIDDNRDKRFHGMPVYPLSKVIDKVEDYFIVVAVGHAEYGKVKRLFQGGVLNRI